jgi:hypothetical protein
LAAEWQRLDALLTVEPIPTDLRSLKGHLLERNEELCGRIRSGEADTGKFRQAVMMHVRQTVRDKLAVANPKLLASEDAGPIP